MTESAKPRTVRIAAGAVAFLLAVPALAHHGFGRFDRSTDVSIEGVLTGLDFVNPHSYVYFDVTGPDGTVTQMGCEMRAATVLRRSGWSPELFIDGAQIVVNGHPHRDDPTSCYAETLAIGDAPTLERYQQLSDTADSNAADRPYRRPDGTVNLAGDWAQEQYLLAQSPGGRGGLVPKSLVAAVEAGEIAVADVPDAGWGPRPVTLTAAGEAAAEVLRNTPPERNPRITCEITNILFDWVFDGPINRIAQDRDTITMIYGRGLTRTIHMGMSAHPPGITPSRGGHSIGAWDGDTLVIDSIGFEAGIMAGPVPHSDRLHVVERLTLNPETRALQREFVADDVLYFADVYRGSDTVLPADVPFAADECKELAFEYTEGVDAD